LTDGGRGAKQKLARFILLRWVMLAARLKRQ
jgi:hypothetical protein